MGLQRVGHDWATEHARTHRAWHRKGTKLAWNRWVNGEVPNPCAMDRVFCGMLGTRHSRRWAAGKTKTISPPTPSIEKLSSMKLVPSAKKVGDLWDNGWTDGRKEERMCKYVWSSDYKCFGAACPGPPPVPPMPCPCLLCPLQKRLASERWSERWSAARRVMHHVPRPPRYLSWSVVGAAGPSAASPPAASGGSTSFSAQTAPHSWKSWRDT